MPAFDGPGVATNGRGSTKRWLAIVEEPFLPANAGGRVEARNMLQALHAEGFQLHVILCSGAPVELDPYKSLLPGATFSIFPRKEGLRSVLCRSPYVVISRPMPAWGSRVLEEPFVPDVILSVHFRVAHLGAELAKRAGVPHLVRGHNIDSEYYKLQARGAGGARSLGYAWESRKLRAFERDINSSPYVTCIADISLEDHLRRRQEASVSTVHVPPFLTPIPVRQRPSSDAEQNGLLFVGGFDTPTNTEGLRWFFKTVWPTVRFRHPAARIEVVGRRPSRAFLSWLQEQPSVDIRVDVPNITDYLNPNLVFINPMLAGSGINIKIVEAMAAGLPVVSTAVGARGLDWRDGEQLIICDDAESFGNSLGLLLDDPARRREIGAAGQKFVTETMNWGRLTTLLQSAAAA